MSFGTRLKEKRESLGITQPQLAEMLNVSKGAIGNWETDVNSPRATLLYDLFDILHCDANYLFQDETRELYKDEASPEEFENIIKKYRIIAEYSPDGASVVDTILDRECEIAKKFQENKKRIEELEKNIDTEKKIANFPSHVSEDIPDYLIVQAAHNDAKITDEELENMKSDIEFLKKNKNKRNQG